MTSMKDDPPGVDREELARHAAVMHDSLRAYRWMGFMDVPEHMHHGLVAYVVYHQVPGDFLEALLCNDLKEAFGRADEKNFSNMGAIVGWLYNYAPAPCWGSREKFLKWLGDGPLV